MSPPPRRMQQGPRRRRPRSKTRPRTLRVDDSCEFFDGRSHEMATLSLMHGALASPRPDNAGAVLPLRAVQSAQSAMLLPDGRGAAPPRMATPEQQESAA